MCPQVKCERIIPLWIRGTHSMHNNQVDLWSVKISRETEIIKKLSSLLSSDEQETAEKFYREQDRENFVNRRSVLRLLLSKYLSVDASNLKFVPGKNKKPVLFPSEEKSLRFNVSCSDEYVLISISESETGVDIERLNPDFPYEDILSHCFSEREITAISMATFPVNEFFNQWVRKEALTKATAKGVDDDLPSVPALDGIHQVAPEIIDSERNWQAVSFMLTENYTGCLVYQPECSVNYYEFQLADL